MHAITVQDDQQLDWQQVPDPAVGPDDVLIRTCATAVNRADLVQRAGAYAPPPGASPILGLECSGVVEAVGAKVRRYSPGDEVCALLAGGGYAEKVAVPEGQVLPVPDGISLTDAAGLPEAFATAYLNLYMEGRAQPGERLLLHAGASGVGTAGIQLARMLGNPVWVTAGSDVKISRCIEFGAAAGHNRQQGSFAEAVHDWTDGAGMDVILDPVGGAYLADNLRSLAADGRLIVIGLMGGTRAKAELGLMMIKRLRLIGSTLRARSVAAKTALMCELEQKVWPHIAAGDIKPVIEARLPLQKAADAHALIADNQTFGKVLLTLN